MSITIDPTIRVQLERFDHRHRRWALAAAGLAAIAVWLIGVLLFTWIDAVWILDRGTRLLLSVATYISAIVAALFIYRRRVTAGDPIRQAAIAIERQRPEYRDVLLSAVELAGPGAASGSPTFIAAAQSAVAGSIRWLDVGSLLPVSLLSRPIAIAAGVAIVCAALVFVPQLQYGNRFARAIIPGFDIDRVSQTQILIQRPDPASRTVPANEITAIVVRLEGRPADEATLQWRGDDGTGGELNMRPASSPSEDPSALTFAVNLPIAEVPVAYRIFAGDGMTRWQHLQPRFRPEAIEFTITVTPPPYTKLPPVTTTASDGNIRALDGSSVKLKVQFNMPVDDVQLRMVTGEQRVDMMSGDDAWTIGMRVNRNDRYQVLATATETGFDNPLSPQYTITPLDDQIPIVNWLFKRAAKTPLGDLARSRRELITNFSKLKLAATYEDEMPMDRLIQEVSVNDGPWQKTTLAGETENATQDHSWTWDLELVKRADKPLAPGDVIRTRAVALDRKGQRGESSIKEYIISDQQFDDTKRERLATWMGIAEKMDAWLAAVTERLVSLKIEDRIDPPLIRDDAKRPAVLDDVDARKSLDEALVAMMDDAATDSESAKIETAARTMMRVEDALREAETVPLDKRGEWRWVTSHARAIATSIRADVAHQLSMMMSDSMMRMAASIQPTVRENDPVDWTTLDRYFDVTREQFKDLSATIKRTMPFMTEASVNHNSNFVRWIDEEQRRLSESRNSEQQFRDHARYLHEQLRNRRTNGVIDGQVASMQNDSMRQQQQAIGWVRDAVNRMKQWSEQIAGLNEKVRSGSSEEVRQSKAEIADMTKRRGELMKTIATRARHDGDWHEHRGEPDQHFIADTHLMQRVMETIVDDAYAPPRDRSMPAVLQEIGDAYHVLETGHDMTQWGRELRTLADDDRWLASTTSGRIDYPNRIERIGSGMEHSTTGLQSTGIDWSKVEPLASLRWNGPMNEARDVILSRRWRNEEPVSAADSLDRIHKAFVAASVPVEEAMERARGVLKSYLPSIADQSRKTAETLAASKPNVAKPDEAAPIDDAPTEAALVNEAPTAETQKRDEAIRKAEALNESLRDEANTQDLMTDDGRRKARNADIAMRAIDKRMDQVAEAAQQTARADANADANPKPNSNDAPAQQAVTEATDKAIDTLNQIADHYDKEYPSDLDDGDKPDADAASPTGEPPSLKSLEDDLQLASAMDEQYARSDSIAKALDSDPEELLKKLQAELKRNPLMQNELTMIADQALSEAQRNLEKQAARERELQLQLEQSDPKFRVAKRELEDSIRRSGEAAQEVERALMSAANQSADSLRDLAELSRLRTDTAKATLQDATQAVRDAVQKANDVGSADNQLMSELKQRASEMDQAMATASETLRTADQPLEEIAGDNESPMDANRLGEERRNMENIQRRARDNQVQLAREAQRAAAGREQRRENELREERQHLQNQQDNRRRTEERQQREPDNRGLADELKKQDQQIALAEAKVQAAEGSVEKSKQTNQQLNARADEFGRKDLLPLDKPQPAAQLAQMMERQSVEQLNSARESLRQSTQNAPSIDAMRSARDAVSNANNAQDKVGSAVDDIAQDLSRAARHQSRLGENEIAKSIDQSSESIVAARQGAVQQADDQLQSADNAMANADANSDAGTGEARQAKESLSKAQTSLAEEAQRLGEAAAASAAQAAAAAQSQAAAAAESASAVKSARQKAQTLDELDRSLAAAQSASASGDKPSSSSSKTATLSAAARKQAQSMAKARNRNGKPQSKPKPGDGKPDESTVSGSGTSDKTAEFFDLSDLENSADPGQWGKLKTRSAEDVTQQRRIEISPQYRRQIEAYFRVIAEQAKP